MGIIDAEDNGETLYSITCRLRECGIQRLEEEKGYTNTGDSVHTCKRERTRKKDSKNIFCPGIYGLEKIKKLKKKRKLYLFQVIHLESFSPLKPRIFFFKSSILCFALFVPQYLKSGDLQLNPD